MKEGVELRSSVNHVVDNIAGDGYLSTNRLTYLQGDAGMDLEETDQGLESSVDANAAFIQIGCDCEHPRRH